MQVEFQAAEHVVATFCGAESSGAESSMMTIVEGHHGIWTFYNDTPPMRKCTSATCICKTTLLPNLYDLHLRDNLQRLKAHSGTANHMHSLSFHVL